MSEGNMSRRNVLQLSVAAKQEEDRWTEHTMDWTCPRVKDARKWWICFSL